MYVYQSPLHQDLITDPGDPQNSIIIVRTSTDGVTWTPAQLLGKTTATPGIGCGTSKCSLALPNAKALDSPRHLRLPRMYNLRFRPSTSSDS